MILCQECAHFREYRPLAPRLEQELSTSIAVLQVLRQVDEAELETQDAEVLRKVHLAARGVYTWPSRPLASSYCGEKERSAVFHMHEVRNQEACGKTPRLVKTCHSCMYRMVGKGWEEDKDSRRECIDLQEESLTLMRKLDELIEQQQATEAHRAYYHSFFIEAPRYLSHCNLHSQPGHFVPCVVQNPHDACPDHCEGGLP